MSCRADRPNLLKTGTALADSGCRSTNASDKRSRLDSADANRISVGGDTGVADIDAATSSGDIKPGVIAQCDVAGTGRITKERSVANSRVRIAGRIA